MNQIVSSEEWLAARKALLEKEKEFSRLRDELTQQRRELPWERVEKEYVFQGAGGQESLADLFGDCSQLLIYHFMFGPDWQEGCKICSMCADHYDPLIAHLQARDVSMVTVSRSPVETLEAFKARKGWSFKWLSSLDNDFNWDFHVSFTKEDMDSGKTYYNYTTAPFPMSEAPGISAFCKDEDGNVFHTYSSFARGLENILGIYNLLDMVPKGRDEAELPFSMAWVRHKENYGKEPTNNSHT